MKQAEVVVNRDFRNRLMLERAHKHSIRLESISRRNGNTLCFVFSFLDNPNCLAQIRRNRGGPRIIRDYEEFETCTEELI